MMFNNLHFRACAVAIFLLIEKGSSFLSSSTRKTVSLQKAHIGACDISSAGVSMNGLLLASEEVESSLSDMLADAVKLTQDMNTVELGNQVNLQIASDLIVPFVGGIGIVILAVLLSSLVSGTQSKGKATAVSGSKTAAKQAPVEQNPVSKASVTEKAYDLSIPYDAAARLAYKNMLRQQGKTPQFFFSDIVIDEAKFAQFKLTYEEEAVKQVIQKKQARERELALK
ncbi:hypothetical protein FisN_17Lh143 [Fistulifera solaris]|uniref:Uncharacterized protein n=1 Tax=Fistulifera solaris TaxID=1519565 RepID=A0A1Z5K8Q2_FISSO|nr:hypothetical protein FisN_17Lh143 [Fistulifera solaris]|eukprot:GAX22650.1 hypothetical protein FisN_17Lh143 [Fistulifera solaris]